MESRYYCDYSLYIIGCLCVVLLFGSCSTPQQSAQIPVEDLPQILREVKQTPAIDTTSNEDDVKLQYSNESTNVTIPINPQNQDFILELEGLQREVPKPDSVSLQDSVVQKKMAQKIKQVLRDFRRAQDLFYREDYKGAMERIDSSLETQQTADALGLKGTIFFMRDNISSAKYYWNKAVQMDPDIPVPDIPELESLIKEIKGTEESETGS